MDGLIKALYRAKEVKGIVNRVGQGFLVRAQGRKEEWFEDKIAFLNYNEFELVLDLEDRWYCADKRKSKLEVS